MRHRELFYQIKRPNGVFFFDWQDRLDQELLARAHDIIKPALRDGIFCSGKVSEHIQFLRWVASSGVLKPAKRYWRRELTNSALILRRAASILRSHLPRKHPLDSPFGRRPTRPTSAEAKVLARVLAQNAAIIYLESQATEWEELARERASSGKVPDLLKKQCALLAHETLCLLGCRPTLTADGPFYLLAALYYESAVGQPDGNLERACRAAFAAEQHRRQSTDES